MSGWNAQLRNLFHREPIILWSCLIGFTGQAASLLQLHGTFDTAMRHIEWTLLIDTVCRNCKR